MEISTATRGTGNPQIRVLKETVFAGMQTQSFATGQSYTLDGSLYDCTLAGNGTAAIVATGLRLQQGTTGGAGFQQMRISVGNAGDLGSILGEARFRRGQWGLWMRFASWDYTQASGIVLSSTIALDNTGKYGVGLRRTKNQLGTPNTAVGGIAADAWYSAAIAPATYPGVTTADCLLAFFRAPTLVDIYYGTYSGGWPAMESMSLMTSFNYPGTAQFMNFGSAPASAALLHLYFQHGGSGATANTYEFIWDRWRVTSWE
jgi:hypothetical protein